MANNISRIKNRERTIIQKCDIVPIIDPTIYYTTGQILNLGLIPGFENKRQDRVGLYRLLLFKHNKIRYPFSETTKTTIKTINNSKLGSKSAKWVVKGEDLIKFLKLNNVLPK